MISNWIQTSSVLTFTIRSTHSQYPICLLNGQTSSNEYSAFNGEYQFPLKTGTYYSLVCRTHYDIKDYVIKRSFYVSRSFFLGLSIVLLIALVGVIVYWRLWICDVISSLKTSGSQEETSRLIRKEATPSEREAKHLLSPELQSQSYSAVVSPSEWRCYSCMYLNSINNDRCQMCNALNPALANQRSATQDNYPSFDTSINSNSIQSRTDEMGQENEYAESTDED